MEINYTKYNAKSLLEALGSIDAEAYPENYKNLTNEIATRKHEIQEFYEQQANARKLRWSRILTVISVNQLLVALIALVMLVLLFSGLSMLEVVASFFVIILNTLSGLILYKRASTYYVLPYLNIGLQVFAFGFGGVYFNYYGIGGIFLTLDWVSDTFNWLSVSFNLGGSLLEYSNQYNLGFFQIDLLALFYIWVIRKSISTICS
ncbi:hypothetical protein HGG78_18745 [Vibrio aestuarianus]|uniref:hypothetical protein n=1 Tax=Vibrio aestuarianus TaxID=28171 RepID=UPI0015587FA4|nr:hypothetical protein [Vibrio aestuarianus]MDE1221782.1 hypothetical protein [Vibrio aestuarianus]MDE1251205.1 hypothetical protein [Vibrio aestuarianus]NGZ15744.1 hypothetical protein [Vibrio aestuarianus]NKZ51892.1 hypothetical protein [Vibrio aestuarianus]